MRGGGEGTVVTLGGCKVSGGGSLNDLRSGHRVLPTSKHQKVPPNKECGQPSRPE